MSIEDQPIQDRTPVPEDTPQQETISHEVQQALDALEGLPGGEELKQGLDILKKETGNSGVKDAEEEEQPADPTDTKKVADNLIKDTAKKKAEQEEQEQEEEEDGEEIEGGEKKEEKKEAEEKESSLKIKSPIFGGEKELGAKKKTEAPKLEVAADVNKYIKEKTGVDDIQTLVDNFSETREKLSNFDKVEAEKKNLEEIFQKMPTELYQGIEAWTQGKDWKSPILSKPNLDFTKGLENQNEKDLVESYYPGQFSKEEWDDYNSDDKDPGVEKAINLAIRTAKEQFTLDKGKMDDYRTNQLTQAEEFNKKMATSVDKSLEHLKGSIEGIDDGYIKQIKNDLNIAKLNELFLNSDGTFKEDAALKITMATQGYDLLEQYKTIAKHTSQTEERQEILDRTPKTPKPTTKKEDKGEGVRPEIQQQLDELMKGTKKQSIY